MYDERFAKIVLGEIQELAAEIRAIKYVVKPALMALLTNEVLRDEYEQLLGMAKAARATMKPGETNAEIVAFKALASAERFLNDLSDCLEKPLRPKAVLGAVPPSPPEV